jgi:hypothetical protein
MKNNRALLWPLLAALPAVLALLPAGCKDFSFYGVLGDRLNEIALQIAPAAVSVPASGGTVTFTATGGTPPYAYSVIPLSGSGTIVAGTGAFTAMTAGDVTVQVTDSKGRTSDAAITITPAGGALAISPVNVSLSLAGGLTFVASGGTAPYAFSLTASGSGSPTIGAATGAYAAGATVGMDTIQVQDAAMDTASATVNVTAAPVTVDYSLVPASFVIPSPVKGGTPVAGASFRLQNALVADGVEDIYWWVYLSDDAALGSGDTLLDADSLGALGAGGWADVPFGGDWPLSSGAKSLFILVSAADDLNSANNASPAVPVALRLPDYQATLTHDSGTTAGAGFTGTLTIDNAGTADGSQDVTYTVYASLNDTAIDTNDKIVASGAVAGGLSVAAAPAVIPVANTWPLTAGSYYLVAVLSAADEIDAAGNQPASGAVAVSPLPVDYQVTTVSSTGLTLAGGALQGEFYYRNNLTGDGTQSVYWIAYVSTDATLTVGVDPVIDSGQAPALNGSTTSATPIDFGGTWPAGMGNRYLFVALSAGDETVTGNNTGSSGAVAVVLPPIDYQVTVVESTGAILSGGPLTGRFRYGNNGTSNGTQTVHWIAYVSTDAALTLGVDPVIDSGDESPLNGSTTSSYVTFEGAWPAGSGNRYLFVTVSASDETVTGNNTNTSGAVPVVLPPVDYQVTTVSSTGFNLAAGALEGEFYYRNALTSNGVQPVHWIAYVSTDSTLIVGTDPVIDSGDASPLNGSTTSPLPVDFEGTWPAGSGDRYLFIVLSAADETVTGNNTGTSGAVPVVLPPVDYTVTAVNSTGLQLAGGSLEGEFSYRNNGTSNGTQPVHWIAYVSTDSTLTVGTDPVIDSGDASPLNGSTTSPLPVDFEGTWPAGSGGRYLFVVLSAADETVTGNNTGTSGAVPVVLPPVDYQVTTVSSTGLTRAGGSLGGEFYYRNALAANGTQPVHWIAYVSTDATLSVGVDPVIDSGMASALNGSTTSPLPVVFEGAWPAGSGDRYLFVVLSAADDTIPGNNTGSSGAVPVGVTDYSGAVTHLSGSTAGDSFTFSMHIDNISGAFALPGSQDLYWNVYASFGDTAISVDDKVVGSGVIGGGLPAGGSYDSGVLANAWPASPGPYYLVADIYAGDDADTANNRPNILVPVTAPLPPDYAVSFSAPPAWSAVVNTAIGGQFRIQNLSANKGLQAISYSVYRSSDRVLGGDTLLVSGTQPPLTGGAFVNLPATDGDVWPPSGQFCYLIATISAADDPTLGNNTVVSHPIAVANFRYVEGAEDNDDSGPTPPAFSNVSLTGLTLTLIGTIAIEGLMDPYQGVKATYDTFRFITGAGVGGISMKARWETGYDDIDLYLWNASGGEVNSIDTDLDSEPAGVPNLIIIGISPSTNYFASANFWLANNTSGSAGKPYVMLLTGNPP